MHTYVHSAFTTALNSIHVFLEITQAILERKGGSERVENVHNMQSPICILYEYAVCYAVNEIG
jgi:hypothetical protein